MRLIDTHCHLNDRSAFPLPEEAVREAVEASVVRLVVVGVDTESSRYAVELADRYAPVYAVVGWHPNHASQFTASELPEIEDMLAHPKVVAIGEIGLDYYRDHATKEEQYRCLFAQLDLARKSGVPAVFHCRDAYPDLLDVLEKDAPPKILLHCFAGTLSDAERAASLGAWFGVDGPVTYKSADALRATLRTLPPDKILIETDAPWMAPVPYRGQRNKPAWVRFVNAALSDALGLDESDCAEMTTRNALSFYGDLGLTNES